ncbi:DUF58 domain-containing protein [Halomarina rubra]|uniref:DUF58 domain-containing protein n=1 Tax=Halomarina rubra TaxID=2071873 RepID=A0ABD6AQD8_9EURY|nr:DUF58 domain-containing protein [Halomarina rubra]
MTAGAPDERTLATRRWHGVAALAVVTTAVGVVTARPGLLLVSVVGVAVAAYASTASAPATTLALTRTVDTERPSDGETVTVTVTVENTGEAAVSDLRLVDGVPSGLAVVEGTAQFTTALRPGAIARFEYDVRAARGDHRFDPATAVVRDAGGARERRVRLVAPTRLRCVPRLGPLAPPALRALTTRHSGPRRTPTPGAGTEFVTVREYRRGDPPSRIDWRRRARTGDLATVEFAEPRALRVLVLVDARPVAYAAPGDDEVGTPDASTGHSDTAVDRSVAAAGRLFAGLLDAGHTAGLAALSPRSFWLAPGGGAGHRARGRRELALHPAFDATPPDADVDERRAVDRLVARLANDTQVVVLSPLVDESVLGAIRRLDAAGHRVSVLSPDVTGTATPGEQAARLERVGRIRSLRGRGVPVLDWRSGTSLDRALAGRRWL